MNPLIESWSWLTSDYKVEKTTENSVLLKVYPGRGGAVSKNRREYLEDEFIRAARTASGKFMDSNHNHKKVGKVHLGDYEDGELEFVCEVWKEPFVTLLRTRSPEIKGFSIDASYLFNECPYCHEKFGSDDAYYDHMEKVEFKPVTKRIPRGIIFNEYALSIVHGDEVPGMDTRYEIMETVKEGSFWLPSKVINSIEEKYMMNKRIAVSSGASHISVGKSGVQTNAVAEEDEKVEQTEEKKEDKSVEKKKEDEEEKKKKKEEEVEEVVQKQEPEEKEEVAKEEEEKIEVQETVEPQEPLDLGEPCSAKLKSCVDQLIAKGTPEERAWKICRSQLGESITLRESKVGEAVWKPIKFAAFESVLEETKDELQAARVVKQNREINEAFNSLTSFINEIVAELNKPLVVQQMFVDETWRTQIKGIVKYVNQIAERVNKLPKDDLGWKRIKPYDDKPLREAIAAIKPYDDAELREKIDAIKPFDDAELKEMIEASKYDDAELKAQLVEVTKKLPEMEEAVKAQMEDLNGKLAELTEKVEASKYDDTELKAKIEDIEGKFTVVKEAYEADLAAYRKDLEEYWKPLERKVKDLEEKKLKETESITAKIDGLQVAVENLTDKQTGNFKGVAQKPGETKKKSPDLTYKPGGA